MFRKKFDGSIDFGGKHIRPIIFNPTDLEDYVKTRGFLYTPYNEWTPGSKIKTQEDLINLTLVSKKVNTDCKSSSIEWKIIPTIETSPTKRGAPDKLLRQLQQ